MEVKNAKIRSTSLGVEGHGIFTFMLHLDYGGSGQGAGGFGLDGHDESKDYRPGFKGAIPLLNEILRVAGVDTWEDLPGTLIRVSADDCEVEKIGHITDDKWLNFKSFIKKLKDDN